MKQGTESEKVTGMLERYREQYVALSATQTEIDTWLLDFVGVKEGIIVDDRRSFNGIFGAVNSINTGGKFSGWRDHPRRMVVDRIDVRTSGHRRQPEMKIVLYGRPVKSDGSPFLNASASCSIDLVEAAISYYERKCNVEPHENYINDALAEYIEFVLISRKGEIENG